MKTRFSVLMAIVSLTLIYLASGISSSEAELMAYWPLDEGKGTEIEDATGNGFNGTFKGDPAWVDGMYGKALEFDGDDYVEVPDAANIKPESITMATWVYFDDVSGRRDFISRDDDYAFSLGGNPGDGKLWAVITTAGDWLDVGGETPVETSKWYHMALTYDQGTKVLILYLDGKVDGEGSAPAGMEHRRGGPLTIGTFEARYLKGKLDEIKIWDEALPVEEIRESMKPATVEPAGKLVTAWAEIKSN